MIPAPKVALRQGGIALLVFFFIIFVLDSTATRQSHAHLGLDSFAIGRAYSNRAAPRPWLFVARSGLAHKPNEPQQGKQSADQHR